jgi:hypothetical protein
MLFVALFGGLVIVALVLALGARARHRREGAWQQFAASRQLSWHNGQIAGVVNGFTIALLIEVRGSGKQQHEVAVARCSLGSTFSPQFALEREGLGDKLMQVISGQDHQLGDPKLDSTFLLHNVDGGARRVLSDDGARSALLTFVERYPSLRIGNGVLQLELRQPPADALALSAFLQDTVSLATSLQRAKRKA